MRSQALKAIIGRTQELLYEIEHFIYQALHQDSSQNKQQGGKSSLWQNLEIIIDSPMAANFTQQYRSFIHLSVINYLASRNKPAIVIAASGMCSGGRIVNYLERFLPDPKADVIFVGYQAQGTPGRDIQKYGPRGGYVYLPGQNNQQRTDINAGIPTISGYSAHADQAGLINFVKRMRHQPQQIRIVHGGDEANATLAREYQALITGIDVVIPRQ